MQSLTVVQDRTCLLKNHNVYVFNTRMRLNSTQCNARDQKVMGSSLNREVFFNNCQYWNIIYRYIILSYKLCYFSHLIHFSFHYQFETSQTEISFNSWFYHFWVIALVIFCPEHHSKRMGLVIKHLCNLESWSVKSMAVNDSKFTRKSHSKNICQSLK